MVIWRAHRPPPGLPTTARIKSFWLKTSAALAASRMKDDGPDDECFHAHSFRLLTQLGRIMLLPHTCRIEINTIPIPCRRRIKPTKPA